jgi:peptidoglycan/LPS O-acetylase OafA/YrhL
VPPTATTPPSLVDIVGTSSRLPALDGLRAVAVAAVIVFHYGLARFALARLGVSLFFVLSGFLITLLLVREREKTGDVSLKNFYIRRALRIFPAYYTFLGLSFLFMIAAGIDTPPLLVLSSLFYLLNNVEAFNLIIGTPVSHGWSLAVEEQFYLLWPALLRACWARGYSVRRVIFLAIAAICLWRTVLWANGIGNSYQYYAFDTRFDSLLVGCGLAICVHDGWLERLARAVTIHPLAPLLTVVLLGALQFLPPRWWYNTVSHTSDAILLAILLVQALLLNRHWLWSWLEWRWVGYMGSISYPLYLYHQLVNQVMEQFWLPRLSVQLVVKVGLTFAMAMASYHFLEMPFLRLKGRFGGAARTDAVPAAA